MKKELEDLHWHLQADVNNIDNRMWGRNMKQNDMKFIIDLRKRLQLYSNKLHELANPSEVRNG
jgi:hypothetical protein